MGSGDAVIRRARSLDADTPTGSNVRLKDLSPAAWRYAVTRAVKEYARDQCTTTAAALTYRTVFAIPPALIALISLLGVLGQEQASVDAIVASYRQIAPGADTAGFESFVTEILNNRTAGLGLFIGLLVALYAASGYVRAMGQAINIIYDVEEGRSFIRFFLGQYVITALLIAMGATVVALTLVSGPVARWFAGLLGAGNAVVTALDWLKWPITLVIVTVMVALLYRLTPNVKYPRAAWLSVGSLVAIIGSIAGTAGFSFYVRNFSNYDRTYGSLAGIIIFLLWLYLTNSLLLVGAELDAELERARELTAGIKAERELQLPPRRMGRADRVRESLERDVAAGRALRLEATGKTADEADSGSADDEGHR